MRARAIRDWTTTTAARLRTRLRGRDADRGVTSIEYAGIVILVAGIILLITQLNLGSTISGGIKDAVDSII